MKNTWRHYLRRFAATTVVCGATAWSSAMCYAVQLAFDTASDPVYDDGWQGRVVNAAGTAVIPSGDNGGFGFTQWDFTSLLTFNGMRYNYATTDFHAIDDGLQGGAHYSNPHNQIGRAWALGSVVPDNDPDTKEGPPRAGRGFTLEVGQTLTVVFDNPTRRQFFKGDQINLRGGTGGTDGNVCYGGVECVAGSGVVPKAGLNTFEYFTYGEWGLDDATGGFLGVLETDTASAGAVFKVERTGAETYVATLDSLDPLKADYGPVSRTFTNPGKEVDWIEFTFFNPATDTTPTLGELGTDFYIRSMEITEDAPPGLPGDYTETARSMRPTTSYGVDRTDRRPVTIPGGRISATRCPAEVRRARCRSQAPSRVSSACWPVGFPGGDAVKKRVSVFRT